MILFPFTRREKLHPAERRPSSLGHPRRRRRARLRPRPHGPPLPGGPRADLHPPRHGLRGLHRPPKERLRKAEARLPEAGHRVPKPEDQPGHGAGNRVWSCVVGAADLFS